MERRDLTRHLGQNGCELVREGRRHSWWGNPATNARSSVPRHTEVPDPLARKICRDLGVPDPFRPTQPSDGEEVGGGQG